MIPVASEVDEGAPGTNPRVANLILQKCNRGIFFFLKIFRKAGLNRYYEQ